MNLPLVTLGMIVAGLARSADAAPVSPAPTHSPAGVADAPTRRPTMKTLVPGSHAARVAEATAAALADPVEEASAERQFCDLSRRLDKDM